MTLCREDIDECFLIVHKIGKGKPEEKPMRTFDTGATRDDDMTKLDYDGFLSPLALERYAQYMNSHRVQADGKPRDSDNWQKGIPLVAYIKSLFRHMLDVWRIHRGFVATDNKGDVDIEDALCAVIFNSFGYLHEHLKAKEKEKRVSNCSFGEDCDDCGTTPDKCYWLQAHAPQLQEKLESVKSSKPPSYYEICCDCKHSPRNCKESSKPLQDPCPSKETHS